VYWILPDGQRHHHPIVFNNVWPGPVNFQETTEQQQWFLVSPGTYSTDTSSNRSIGQRFLGRYIVVLAY